MPDKVDDDLDAFIADDLNPPDTVEVEENADRISEDYYPVDYAISSYGADYPVDGLVKRINATSIYIPSFQRSYVWNIYRASRFIESLLLGLPVPAIFLSKELDSNKMLVIDGQQRLRTLQFFYNGVFEPMQLAFSLRGVQERFKGKTYKTLSEDERLRLDDSVVHAIVVKQESPNEETGGGTAPSCAYHIFERLNTGGVLLQPQEIRSCVFHGPFNEHLETLNQDANWRALFGNISTRMRDRELILRFLTLYEHADAYARPMKEFLNRFAEKYRRIDSVTAHRFHSVFSDSVKIIREGIGDKAFKTKTTINAALYDSIMIGIARRIQSGPVMNLAMVRQKYDELMQDPRFKAAISSRTTDEAQVKDRLNHTTEAFRNIQ
jgi:uncharacterized protein with ParB-like and HNH nuclease domain